MECNRCFTPRVDAPKKPFGDRQFGGEKKTGLFGPSDWACGKCGNMNWERRNECNICKAPKASLGPDEKRDGAGGGFNERQERVASGRREVAEDGYDDFGQRRQKAPVSQADREAAALARLKASYSAMYTNEPISHSVGGDDEDFARKPPTSSHNDGGEGLRDRISFQLWTDVVENDASHSSSQRHPGNINSINATSSIITLSSKGALPPETVQTFTLAAFVALRVIEHLVDEFQNSRRHQNLHRGIFPLAACRHHLAQLWASTPVKDHHKLLHRDSVTCVQRVLSRRFVSDMHTASSVRVAVRHLLATLTENDIAVHDAAYVAENLFTPTLLSCGAAVDWVGRELGKALVQTSVVAAISVDVTIDTIQAAAISADDRQSGATGKKKK
ncbi:hypothetical protein DYB30_002236 [Aphanomyces astaci]|uniref:RanBP2-type domain-containing protein n=2 Tax=Aphanomyces astaci TaxID=112090 RepID=A0A397DZD9_APHAT|nr:hypothetical protein DYB30_002236 [Aphanomyces astaci]